MGPWTKLDDLHTHVARQALIEFTSSESTSLAAAQDALKRKNFEPSRLVVLGWEILLSRRRQDGDVRWHLSAKIHPPGRPSAESDWRVVGKIAARLGAPAEPAIVPEDPRAAVHWSWVE